MQSTALETVDRQALNVAQAIRTVASSLETHRESYRTTHSDQERLTLRRSILQDIERLSNLLALLEATPEGYLNRATHRALNVCVNRVRERISAIGLSLTLDKIRELRSLAEYSHRRHEHPWGKAYLLKESFLRHMTHLRHLGEELSKEQYETLCESAKAINALISIDRQMALFPSYAGDVEISLIALDSLRVKDDKAQPTEPRPH